MNGLACFRSDVWNPEYRPGLDAEATAGAPDPVQERPVSPRQQGVGDGMNLIPYIFGLCDIFALALHAEFGWPIEELRDSANDIRPDGKRVDADGVSG